VGAGYISADSKSPEGCYRLLKAITARPDLMLGVPARRSQINDPQIASLLGDSIAQLYQMFADRLDAENTITVPTAFSGVTTISGYIESIWINQAFDHYVLEEGDLEADLASAQQYITDYRTCVGDEGATPDFASMTQEEIEAYSKKFTDCAIEIDATLSDRFNFFGSSSSTEEAED
jgi:hypothetical protein